jgi:sortase A
MRRLLLAGNILVAAGALLLIRPVGDFAAGWRAQATGLSPSSASRPLPCRRPAEGEALGRLEFPRLGLDFVVFEGSSEETLRKGPGHLPGTAWPGAREGAGNCVITAHRDSFFRRMGSARRNDLVRVHGPSGTSTYRLDERRIVRPEDVSVIAPTSEERLTLITCYPFSWIGAAPYRLVWSPVPVASESRAARPRVPERQSR